MVSCTSSYYATTCAIGLLDITYQIIMAENMIIHTRVMHIIRKLVYG